MLCGIISGLNEAERVATINDVLGTKNPNDITDHPTGIFNQAFGTTSRITAMFASKKALAEQVTTDFETEIKKLQAKSLALGKAYCRLVEKIGTGNEELCQYLPDTVSNELAKSLLPYKKTFALASALEDTKDRWAGGLLILNGKNYAQELQGPSNNLGEGGILAKISDARSRLTTQSQTISKLSNDISNAIDSENVAKRRVAAMCVHFYCEIVPAGRLFGRFSAYDAACNAPDLVGNKLCTLGGPIKFSISETSTDSGSGAEGQAKELSAICEAAGVERRFLRMNLNRAEANRCRTDAYKF